MFLLELVTMLIPYPFITIINIISNQMYSFSLEIEFHKMHIMHGKEVDWGGGVPMSHVDYKKW